MVCVVSSSVLFTPIKTPIYLHLRKGWAALCVKMNLPRQRRAKNVTQGETIWSSWKERAGEEEPRSVPAQRNTWQKFPAWARPPLRRYAPRRAEAVNRCSVFTNRACAATWRSTTYILRRRSSAPTTTAASFQPTGDFA